MQNEIQNFSNKKVMLVGLGGCGSKIVDKLYGKAKAAGFENDVAVLTLDTNIGEARELENVPSEFNKVLAESGIISSGLSLGQYIDDNPDAKKWFLEGDQYRSIKNIKTYDGAKQIRIFSRVALEATYKYLSLPDVIRDAFSKICNVDDKAHHGSYLVYIICSIAGGTGAGTILQMPYMIKEALSVHENIKFSSALVMPSVFEGTLSAPNLNKAMINAYAVLKELKSLNCGTLTREDMIGDIVETASSGGVDYPFSDVLLFEASTTNGNTIIGSYSDKHIPIITENLYQYIFGPCANNATGSRDNALEGQLSRGAFFGGVGYAKLAFPIDDYKSYAACRWISSSMSKYWLLADAKANREISEKNKDRNKAGKPKLTDREKRSIFCNTIKNPDMLTDSFHSEIRNQLKANPTTAYACDVDEDEPSKIEQRVQDIIDNDESICDAIYYLQDKAEELRTANKKEQEDILAHINSGIKELSQACNNAIKSAKSYARDFIRPFNAASEEFLNGDNNDYNLYTYIRKANFHPVALKHFLYGLLSIVEGITIAEGRDAEKEFTAFAANDKIPPTTAIDKIIGNFVSNAVIRLTQGILIALKPDVEMLVGEIDDLFNEIKSIHGHYSSQALKLAELADRDDDEVNVTIASSLGMEYCWKIIDRRVNGNDADGGPVLDETLSERISRIIYLSYVDRIESIEAGISYVTKTNYSKILKENLTQHFFEKVDQDFGSVFPQDIVEAINFESAVNNYFTNQKTLYDSQKASTLPEYTADKMQVTDKLYKFNEEEFATTTPVQCFNSKLVELVRKSEPNCGTVGSMDENVLMVNRYIDFNHDIIQGKSNTRLNEFMPGVSTTDIGQYNVSISSDTSYPDKYSIVCLSNFCQLELDEFSSLSDSLEHPSSYYLAYKKRIDEMMTPSEEEVFTPHVNKNWHIAGMLEDISSKLTNAIEKEAAEAFVYGFIYNTIRIESEGEVYFGEYHNENFRKLATESDDATVMVHHSIKGSKRLEYLEGESKAKTDGILAEIYDLLRTNDVLRDCIIKDAKDKLQDDVGEEGLMKLMDLLNDAEECFGFRYNNILDVLDGFYKGAIRRLTSKAPRATERIQATVDRYLRIMFETLTRILLDVCMTNLDDDSDYFDVFKDAVDYLYRKAICDDGMDTLTKSAPTRKKLTAAVPTEQEKIDSLSTGAMLLKKTRLKAAAQSKMKPFSAKGKCSKNNMIETAINLINQMD